MLTLCHIRVQIANISMPKACLSLNQNRRKMYLSGDRRLEGGVGCLPGDSVRLKSLQARYYAVQINGQ